MPGARPASSSSYWKFRSTSATQLGVGPPVPQRDPCQQLPPAGSKRSGLPADYLLPVSRCGIRLGSFGDGKQPVRTLDPFQLVVTAFLEAKTRT